MLEIVYGNYNDFEEKEVYEEEDIDEARARAIFLSQEFDYDFVVLKDVDNDKTIFEQFN
jgi:hypothetical protein